MASEKSTPSKTASTPAEEKPSKTWGAPAHEALCVALAMAMAENGLSVATCKDAIVEAMKNQGFLFSWEGIR
jgi:hypothetical protein